MQIEKWSCYVWKLDWNLLIVKRRVHIARSVYGVVEMVLFSYSKQIYRQILVRFWNSNIRVSLHWMLNSQHSLFQFCIIYNRIMIWLWKQLFVQFGLGASLCSYQSKLKAELIWNKERIVVGFRIMFCGSICAGFINFKCDAYIGPEIHPTSFLN